MLPEWPCAGARGDTTRRLDVRDTGGARLAPRGAHELCAHADGVVDDVRVEVGQMVDPDAVLVVVTADAS